VKIDSMLLEVTGEILFTLLIVKNPRKTLVLSHFD
jgi:hypothetical protein